MVTLLTYTDSRGTRRCDARCYNGKRPRCKCICDGHNHGAGLAQAEANTRAMIANLAERAGNIELAHQIRMFPAETVGVKP